MTMGATGQDFAKASGSTCAAQNYSAPTSCTINITVSPAAAGLRMGGLLIFEQQGLDLRSSLRYGNGAADCVHARHPKHGSLRAEPDESNRRTGGGWQRQPLRWRIELSGEVYAGRRKLWIDQQPRYQPQ